VLFVGLRDDLKSFRTKIATIMATDEKDPLTLYDADIFDDEVDSSVDDAEFDEDVDVNALRMLVSEIGKRSLDDLGLVEGGQDKKVRALHAPVESVSMVIT